MAENKNEPKKTKNAQEAERIFKQYPKAKELFFTADNTAFFKRCDADNHAKTLKDKTVKTEKR